MDLYEYYYKWWCGNIIFKVPVSLTCIDKHTRIIERAIWYLVWLNAMWYILYECGYFWLGMYSYPVSGLFPQGLGRPSEQVTIRPSRWMLWFTRNRQTNRDGELMVGRFGSSHRLQLLRVAFLRIGQTSINSKRIWESCSVARKNIFA